MLPEILQSQCSHSLECHDLCVATVPAYLCQICCLGVYRLGLSMCMTTAWQSRNGSDMLTRPRAGPEAEGRALPASQASLQRWHSAARPDIMSLAYQLTTNALIESTACHILLLMQHMTDLPERWTSATTMAHIVFSQSTSKASDPDASVSCNMVSQEHGRQ